RAAPRRAEPRGRAGVPRRAAARDGGGGVGGRRTVGPGRAVDGSMARPGGVRRGAGRGQGVGAGRTAGGDGTRRGVGYDRGQVSDRRQSVRPRNTVISRARLGGSGKSSRRALPGPSGRISTRSPRKYATESSPHRNGSRASRASRPGAPVSPWTHSALGSAQGTTRANTGSPSSTARPD